MEILRNSLFGLGVLLVGIVLLLGGIMLLRRMRSTPQPSGGQAAMKYLWPAAVVIGCVVLAIVLWMAPSGTLEAPSVADVVEQSRKFWLWIIILWGIGHALIGLNSSTLGRAAPVLHWVLPVVVFFLFAILPIIGWASDSKTAAEVKAEKEAAAKAALAPTPAPAPRARSPVRAVEVCTEEKPCTLRLLADGSTEKVRRREGTYLCFDRSFYTNFEQLGFVSSYNGVETSPGCRSASCNLDTFWFTPEEEVDLPKYWDVPGEPGEVPKCQSG